MGCLFKQAGGVINYTPTSAAVEAGEVVVIGSLIGIATNKIPQNTLGALTIDGHFICPKDSNAITAGASVYWDATNSKATATSTSNTLMGIAPYAAAAGDSTVYVILG